jgi:pimeloyl-ACP methyl ester carboxylesterase
MHDFANIDHSKLGTIGYSVGGVAALNFVMRNNDVDALVTLDPTFGVTPFIKLATESPYYQPTRARVSWLYFYRTEPATNLEVFDQLIARTPQVNSAAASIGKQQERAAIEPPPTEQRFLRVFEQQGFQPAIRLQN